MLLQLTDEQRQLQTMPCRVADERVAPRAAAIEATAQYPEELFDLDKGLGLFGSPATGEVGGVGSPVAGRRGGAARGPEGVGGGVDGARAAGLDRDLQPGAGLDVCVGHGDLRARSVHRAARRSGPGANAPWWRSVQPH